MSRYVILLVSIIASLPAAKALAEHNYNEQSEHLIAEPLSPAAGFPWQAAPGQASYQFLYYPETEVYFYPEREFYFYTVDSQWVKAPTLQQQLQEKLGDFIVLEIASEQPYEFHQHIIEYYGPDNGGINEIQVQAGPRPPVNYHYRYYPEQSVYYDEIRRTYFYQERGHWVHSTSPAQEILRALGSFISFTLHTPRPYERHALITRVHRLGAVRPRINVHRYYYYPQASVYHDVNRGLYHYLGKNRWHTVRVLPPSITVDIKQRLSLDLATKRPYLFHRHIDRTHAAFTKSQKTHVKVKIDAKDAGGKIKIKKKVNNKVKIKSGKPSHKQAKSKNKGKNQSKSKSKNKNKNKNKNKDG